MAEAIGDMLRQRRYGEAAGEAAKAIAAVGDGAVNAAGELERMRQT